MSLDNTQIYVPSRTFVWLAPVGTTVPVTPTEAPGIGFFNVGYTPEDSLSFATSPNFSEVRSAQSDYETRRFQVSDAASFSVDLQQFNLDNVKAAYGGGTVTKISTDPAPAVYKFVPPKIGERVELCALIDVEDGAKHYRYIAPRVWQNEGVTQNLHKGAESRLPLRFQILGSDAGDPFYMLTDDPAFTVV